MARVRSLLISDHVAWANEAQGTAPEAIERYRLKIGDSLKDYVSNGGLRARPGELEEFVRLETTGWSKQAFLQAALSPLLGLARPELAGWVIGIFGPPEAGNAEQARQELLDLVTPLAVQAGRPASLEILRRLGAEGGVPPAIRDQLLALLRKIEGSATEAVLRIGPSGQTTVKSVDQPRVERRSLSFMLVPMLLAPVGLGEGQRRVVRLSNGARVVTPEYSQDDWNSENGLVRILGQLRGLGDVGFTGDGMLVASQTYEKLPRPIWVSGLKLPQLGGRALGEPLARYRGNDAFVLRTIDGDVAIVQLLGASFNWGMAIAYTVVPADHGEITVSIPSPLGFVLQGQQERSYGEIAAHRLCIQARESWFFHQCLGAAESLRGLLDPASDATDEERISAIQLLGELRSFESADTLVGLIASQQPEGIQSAARDALARMTPNARHAFHSRLKVAEGPSRERLIKAFRFLETDSVADFLLALWTKEGWK